MPHLTDANPVIETSLGQDRSSQGIVLSVRGSVVDARFSGRRPFLYNVLKAGENGRTAVDVITCLDDRTVRGIALTSTQGLAQGSMIIDTGHPLRVPVGKQLMGRVFNVFGETIDRGDAVAGSRWRSIHQVPLNQRPATANIYLTGITSIDVLTPSSGTGKPACSAVPVWDKRC